MHNRATANPSPRVNGDFGAIPYHKKNTQKKKESATATPCPAHLKLLQGALHNFKAGRRATPPRLKLGHPDGLPALQCPLVSLRQSLLQRKAPTVSQSQAPFTRSDSFAGNVLMFLAKPNSGVDFIFLSEEIVIFYFYFLRFLVLDAFFFSSQHFIGTAGVKLGFFLRSPPSAFRTEVHYSGFPPRIAVSSRQRGVPPKSLTPFFFRYYCLPTKTKTKQKNSVWTLEAQHLNA